MGARQDEDGDGRKAAPDGYRTAAGQQGGHQRQTGHDRAALQKHRVERWDPGVLKSDIRYGATARACELQIGKSEGPDIVCQLHGDASAHQDGSQGLWCKALEGDRRADRRAWGFIWTGQKFDLWGTADPDPGGRYYQGRLQCGYRPSEKGKDWRKELACAARGGGPGAHRHQKSQDQIQQSVRLLFWGQQFLQKPGAGRLCA